MCISREQEEFLSAYRTDEARQAFIDSYGKEKVNFFDSGYLENIQKPIVPEPVLPYDSVLEYLEFTGQQYLGLGVMGSLDIGCDIGIMPSPLSLGTFVFGCRLSRSSDAFYVTISVRPGRFICNVGNGESAILDVQIPDMNGFYRIVMNRSERQVFYNDSILSQNIVVVNTDFTTPHQLYVGYRDSLDNTGNIDENFIGRYYYVKLYRDGVEFMHLIPVVKDGVGCMYDLYSKELFYNIGEGDFILGPVVEK